ncbi:Membrane protein related to metalloendopeptidase [Geitlerinema sp. FC II]|nr:Membrane protein related to metalloendopeptidase [Geitlerinema sp. FC II]
MVDFSRDSFDRFSVSLLSLISIFCGKFVVSPALALEPLIFEQRETPIAEDRQGEPSNSGTQPSPDMKNACIGTTERIRALVPAFIPEEDSENSARNLPVIWDFTLEETPTFWFYVPYQAPLTARFSLVDENSFQLYSDTFSLPDRPGVIGVNLPTNIVGEDETLLQLDRDYRWQFSVICNPEQPSLDLVVQGWVRRIQSPDIERDLTDIIRSNEPYESLRSIVLNLAREGIWYDSLTAVGTRYFDNPSNETLAADWNSLLKSADLQEYSDFPIVLIHSEF